MALWDVACPEKPSCRISSVWKVCVLDSMVSIMYRMKEELVAWDDNISIFSHFRNSASDIIFTVLNTMPSCLDLNSF